MLFDEQELRTEIRQLQMQLDSEQTYSNQIALGHRSTVSDMDGELKRKESAILDLRKQIGELMLDNTRLKSIPDQDRDYKLHKQQNQLEQQQDKIDELKSENQEIRRFNDENISRINQLKNIIVHLEGQNRQVFAQTMADRKFIGLSESKSERKLNNALKDFKRLTSKNKTSFDETKSKKMADSSSYMLRHRKTQSASINDDLRSNASGSSNPLRSKSRNKKVVATKSTEALEKISEEGQQ